MIWISLLAGMAIAFGLWLLAGSMRRTPPNLATVQAEYGVSVAARRADPARSAMPGRSRLERFAGFAPAQTSFYRGLERDLRVVDYGVDYVVYQQVLAVVAGFAFPLVFFLLILPLAGLTLTPAVALLLAVAGAAGGFYLPIYNLRSDAADRRRDFAASLSQYVSFVDVMVSGGNSIDGSFEFAAELGDGWAWDELRFAIASASSATLAPYRALRILGDDIAVVELSNLARRLEQTQSTGAAIGPALRSLANGLSNDQGRQAKIADDRVTEQMTFPLMVVLFSLLTFFGIAAVTAILRAADGF